MHVVQLEPKPNIFIIEFAGDRCHRIRANSFRLLGSFYAFYDIPDHKLSENFRKNIYVTPIYEIPKSFVECVYREDIFLGEFTSEADSK